MIPQFPIYIPSKSRHEVRYTSDYLTYCKIPHTLVVEETQHGQYRDALSGNPFASLLILDEQYKRDYELCDDLGLTKSTGPGPARNFMWDHAISIGAAWHWTMDDNIHYFFRMHQNRKIRIDDGAIFRAMEDFCQRYDNVAMAGPAYDFFNPRKEKRPPFILNTRIYSCNLIRNDVPFRWRGRYNEDTILSLDMLKAGWCTIQFNAYQQKKIWTQVIKGGNTEEFYAKEGTRAKSEMQVAVHPDVSRLAWRFNRIHHYVDYRPFKKNKLHRKKDIVIPDEPNNYGMKLVKIK